MIHNTTKRLLTAKKGGKWGDVDIFPQLISKGIFCMIQNYFVGAKLTRSDIKSQSSCINRDRNEFGSRESVVFVVKKYWPPTFNFTQFSVPCFFRTLGLLRVFILTVVILFLHFCFILLSLYFVIKYKVISKIFFT